MWDGKQQILRNIGRGHHQTSRDENNKKIVPQKNEKTLWNEVLQQKYHQRNKHVGRRPCKIFWIILKIDKEGTQTNEPNDQEIGDYAKILLLRDDIDYNYQEGRWFASIEYCIDVSIQGQY